MPPAVCNWAKKKCRNGVIPVKWVTPSILNLRMVNGRTCTLQNNHIIKNIQLKTQWPFASHLAKLRKRRKVGSCRFSLEVFVLEVRSVSSCPASVCLIVQLREYSCAGEFRARHTWRTTDLRWFNISTAGELLWILLIIALQKRVI